MIAISLSPNAQKDDILLALGVLVSPWRWIKGSSIKNLEEAFKKYFDASFAICFDSGRSSEYAILKALRIGKGHEVAIQAFTCVAVPNSILWTQATPLYIDVDKTGNIDPKDLEKKITKQTKAVIVQHTFGIAADIEKIKEIAKKHKLILIEDCAHAIGANIDDKKVGTFGDVAFFSFGRDKVISSVSGGMITTNNKRLGEKLKSLQRSMDFPSMYFVFTQLFHPIAFSLILPLYEKGAGKMLLVLLQKFTLLNKPVEEKEKQGEHPIFYPKRLANAQAALALNQFKKLDMFNEHRQNIAAFYTKELRDLPIKLPIYQAGDIFLRYNIRTEKADVIRAYCKKQGILLGRWYGNIFDPKGVNFEKIGYKLGSCKDAEEWAGESLNLPTYPNMTMQEASQVVTILKRNYVSS